MNEFATLTMDKASFLRWAEGRPGRYELVGRRIMMMTGGTFRHARIKANVADALRRQLDCEAWAVVESGMAVEVGPADVRHPDVVVLAADHDPKALSTDRPVIVVEVMSPASAAYDLGDKASGYLRLASLQAYLVVAQDEPRAWVHVREADGFTPNPLPIAAADAVVRVPALAVAMPLADAWRGLSFAS